MKKLILCILLIVISLSMSSCYYDQVEEVEIPPGTVVEFAADIQQVISTFNCTNCHDGSLDPDLREGNAYNALVPEYVTAGDANNSELYEVLASGHAGVDNTSLALIEEWINSGALNN